MPKKNKQKYISVKKLCPVCTRRDGVPLTHEEYQKFDKHIRQKQDKELEKPFDDRKWISRYGKICKDCKPIVDADFTLICSKCAFCTVIDLDLAKRNFSKYFKEGIKAGEALEIHSCAGCSENKKFEILPPK